MTSVNVNLRAVLFAAFAIAAALYALSSIEYFISFASKPAPMWDSALAMLTSGQFIEGPGSVRVEMHDPYHANRVALQIHATTGGTMLLLGIFQFSTGFRRKFPVWHRNMGKVYVVLAAPTGIGTLVYLYNVPPESVFSGPVFSIALIGLAIGMMAVTWMAYRTARARNFEAHRAWMLQSYFYILSAPILRAVWVPVYQANTGLTHWDNNLYALPLTTALVALGPLVFWGFSQKGARYAG